MSRAADPLRTKIIRAHWWQRIRADLWQLAGSAGRSLWKFAVVGWLAWCVVRLLGSVLCWLTLGPRRRSRAAI